ncbi:MAG: HAD-IB family hydrolase [Spirochaetaceae bacterium]|jgi:HAD superfamily hydrolase (TIGR01490 family)|nr:HAD-IB family hydrolase [Spirochaetaceae bacterium]
MVNIFDVDYTILKKPTAWYFLLDALAEGLISFSQVRGLPFEWLRYKAGSPNQDFIEEAVTHLAGLEQGVLEELGRICFERRMKGGIYTGAAGLIEEMKKRGETVVFATSSIDFMVAPLEQFLGIDGSLATKLAFSDGKTTGGIAGNSLFGLNKKEAAAAWLAERRIPSGDIRFYSDSYTDLPLLEYAGQAIAVNPDRFLKREAKKRGWEILRFHETLT